jgi:chromosome segregation ATPase
MSFTAIQNDTLLHKFLHQELSQADCCHGECCKVALTEGRRTLGYEICSLYLITVILGRSEESKLTENTSMLILRKSNYLSIQSFHCTNKQPQHALTGSNLNLIPQGSVPQEFRAGKNWREILLAHAQVEITCRQSALVRLVEDICHDLEERCDNAEEPFKKEQIRAETLEREISGLKGQKNKLYGQLVERDMLLESLETEKTDTEDSLRSVQVENEQLLARVSDLECSLRDENKAVETEIKRLKTEGESRELDLRAQLATKDSVADDLETRIAEAELQIKDLEANLTSTKCRASELEDKSRVLEVNLDNFERQLNSEKDSRAETEIAYQKTQENRDNLSLALQDSITRYEEASSRFDDQCRRHKSEVEDLKAEMEQLQSRHNASLEELATKLTIGEASHTSQLNDAIIRLDESTKEVSSLQEKVELKDATMSHQQHQVCIITTVLQ